MEARMWLTMVTWTMEWRTTRRKKMAKRMLQTRLLKYGSMRGQSPQKEVVPFCFDIFLLI
jgi:hypothetical protein